MVALGHHVGATHYLTKPADVDDILAAFARADGAATPQVAIEYRVQSLARAEWEHINRVLSDCAGNVSQAARLLGFTAAACNGSSRNTPWSGDARESRRAGHGRDHLTGPVVREDGRVLVVDVHADPARRHGTEVRS